MKGCFENSLTVVSVRSDILDGIFAMIPVQYLSTTFSSVGESFSGLTISKGFIVGSLNLSLDLDRMFLYRVSTAFLNWADLLNMYRCAHSWTMVGVMYWLSRYLIFRVIWPSYDAVPIASIWLIMTFAWAEGKPMSFI